ncbi:MAG: family 20 glycosylhydrolase, partial [Muribaculaceae bacterium]|nr:family 20 glycosylhydrolase [Muribaculaceae bacterium]
YEYYLNRPYGPHYFTVEELKEVVAYAKERHIEVIPEVDMPGHMEAAIAAYPQLSTNPAGEYQVRYWPGVSTNILDVSNPAVMQFCRDVMDELIEIFPYEYIHIGGDECPKTAWANSASVQAMKKELGIDTDAALQCWFSKQIADYVKPKGKRLICWNEVLTAEGADTKMVQDADILIYDWLGGARADGPSYQAAKLGLRSVWCSTYHYYIDYSQWSGPSEPKSMSGPITLQTIYNVQPSTAPSNEPGLQQYYYGVQCNLWTEYVAEPKHVEYNSLPRMIAVAETGWSPQSKKNFEDFKKRFNADTELLDLRGYTYGRHYVDNTEPTPDVVYPAEGSYYRLITRASQDAGRRDRCIELVRQGSPLTSEKSATVGKLWTNTQVNSDNAAYDWQYWTFEPDPAGSGKYAMVCRAVPAGSVSPDMEGSSVNARWNYDNNAKHYNFVVGQHFGQEELNYYYSVRSDKNSSWWLNCGQAAQNNAVNNWSDPADGNGGLWLFSLENYDSPVYPEFEYLTKGENYVLTNTSDEFAGIAMTDGTADDYVRHGSDEWSHNVWTVEESTIDSEHHIQYVTLRNAATGRYIASGDENPVSSTPGVGFFNGDAGYPVRLGAKPQSPNVRITAWEG